MLDPTARILAIETSSRWGSVALGTPAGVLDAAELSAPMSHARDFAPLVANLLDRHGWSAASLTHVFVSVGPGSFTGLRIGVTMARTLAWSIGVRIVAVPTLDALARNVLSLTTPPDHVAVLLDAKRGQVYAAAYRLAGGEPEKLAGPVLEQPPAFLRSLPRPLAVLGEGISFHRAAVDAADVSILPETCWRPNARRVFELGLQLAQSEQYVAGSDLLPLYIRRPEAEEKWEQLHPTSG